jgi:predicted transcriptional regulator YheO
MSRSLLTNETSELDLLDQRPFDQTDFDILKSYEAVVDGLAMLIGSHCEIVLHSLQDLKCSAIRIANGEHTGRKIGSPITDLALRMLHDMTGADSSVSKCYFTRAKSGVLMKSETIAIRNREHRVIGLLCINMNLDVPFSQIMSTFIPPETPDVGSSVNFASSVEDLVTQTLEFTIEEVNADRNVSNNAKNRQIVLNLYEKGIFDIKDAINQVADRLNISKHTVYLYIRQFKSGDFLGKISNAFCVNGDRPGVWHSAGQQRAAVCACAAGSRT